MESSETSISNEPGSMATHAIGTLLGLIASILLILRAIERGTAWDIVAVSVFSFCLIFLYIMSTVYHLLSASRKSKKWLKRLDHTGIYLLIAGTYTAVCITVLRGSIGWTLFGVVWAVAITGCVLVLAGVPLPRWLPALIYALLGWIGILAAVPLYRILGYKGFMWLVGGGMLYTFGIIFYILEKFVPRSRWFGMHEVFHLFVLLGSAAHIYLVWQYILP